MIARLTSIVMLSVEVAAQSGQTTVPAKSPATYLIAGTTVNSLTGQPVAGAHLTVMSVEHNEFVQNVISAVDGHFAFSGLPAGKYSLVASAHGFRSQGFNQHGDFFTGIVVGSGFDIGELIFRLVPDAFIEGVVTEDRKSTRLNSSHSGESRMPSSA